MNKLIIVFQNDGNKEYHILISSINDTKYLNKVLKINHRFRKLAFEPQLFITYFN